MMYKNTHLVLWVLLSVPFAAIAAKEGGFEIDAEIHDVRTFRVGKHLVRYIHYNRLEMPNFVFELIKTPKYVLLHKRSVNEITINGLDGKAKRLDFYNQTMVEVENVRTDKHAVLFEVGFIAAEHTAPYLHSTCRIDIANDAFSGPACRILKWGNEEISSSSPRAK